MARHGMACTPGFAENPVFQVTAVLIKGAAVKVGKPDAANRTDSVAPSAAKLFTSRFGGSGNVGSTAQLRRQSQGGYS